jgi:hypothetical protein
VRIVRLALTATVAMTIAQAFNWPLSFLTPVLVVALFEMPLTAPPMGEFLFNILATVVSVWAIYCFVLLLEPYPLLFIPAYGIAIFWLAYLMNKGAPLVPALLTLVALLVLPIVGNIDDGLTVYIAACLLFSMLLGQLLVQLGFGLLPDPATVEVAPVAEFQRGYSPEAARAALVTALVLVPTMTLFLSMKWYAQLVVILYIGICALAGNVAHSLYDAKKYLIANSIAGIGALLTYALLVAVPELYFLVPLMLLVTLLFAGFRFSDKPGAKYFGSALVGLIILISSSLGADADIDKNLILRIIYIFIAGIYATCAVSLLEPLINPGASHDGH